MAGWAITHNSDIYAIRCKKNGKLYVGRSYRVENRIREHFLTLRKGKTDKLNTTYKKTGFQDDYNKYGEEEFEVYLIEQNVPPEHCQEREHYWIKFYDSANPKHGYNTHDESKRNPFPQVKIGKPPRHQAVDDIIRSRKEATHNAP